MLIIFCLVLYLWSTRPAAAGTPSHGGNRIQADRVIKNCQLEYSKCIQRSLHGDADLSKCHQDFMRNCMPMIRIARAHQLLTAEEEA